MRLRTQSVGGEFFVRTLANLQPERHDTWFPSGGEGHGVRVFSRENMREFRTIQDAIVGNCTIERRTRLKIQRKATVIDENNVVTEGWVDVRP